MDHPRVRGEKKSARLAVAAALGSPPRARGEDAASVLDVGLIRDHPRVRGEKKISDQLAALIKGSPPRARGEAGLCAVQLDTQGITPACAGRSGAESALLLVDGDHPRVRGEKCMRLMVSIMVIGSPPRARGEVHLIPISRALSGITPACAGKSCHIRSNRLSRKDHPRVRGEKCGSERSPGL